MPWTMVEGWPGRVWVDAKGIRTFYIRQRRDAKRYDVTTKCHTLRAAMKELERFEADPDGYAPAGSEDRVVLGDPLIQRYLEWCRADSPDADPRWLRAKELHLTWWAEEVNGRNLASLPLAFIREKLGGVADKAKRIVALKHLYSFLRQTSRITADQDPTRDALPVPQARPMQDVSGSKVIPEADFRAALPRMDEKFADACRLMAATGCHLSEVIRFAKTGEVATGPDGAPVVGFLHKGGHWHRVAVSEQVAEVARRVRARPPLARESTYKAIRKACKDAQVEQWTPGRFRATFATRAVERGASPAAVALALGHTSQVTTLTWYATLAVAPRVEGME